MSRPTSRREIFRLAGLAAGVTVNSRYASAQPPAEQAKPPQRGEGGAGRRGGGWFGGGHPEPFPGLAGRSAVSLIHGEDRRKNAYNALMAIDDQIRPRLKNKKYALIKPNNVSITNQLAASHVDGLRGILDYLSERFKGPVIIAESSAGETMKGFENFKYPALVSEYRKQKVRLIDLNEEAKYVLLPLIDFDLHVVPIRLAARLLDPEGFMLGAAVLKTHNMAIISLAVKNMVVGAPLHQAPKETRRWNDKRRMHVGIRQSYYNMFVTAQRLATNWGATIIDGFEAMEGNGPASGTPVPHRVAIASTDYIAADRVGSEIMGVDANWLGWMKYCGEVGVGQWDLAKLDVRGAQIDPLRRKYRLHSDVDIMLKWMGPMEEFPPNLGFVRPLSEHEIA
jgi:uncharacterized protein (DUF362 family)